MAEIDRNKVMSWLEGLAEDDWRLFHSDSEVSNIAKAALALLKEKEEEIDELESAIDLMKHEAFLEDG